MGEALPSFKLGDIILVFIFMQYDNLYTSLIRLFAAN